MWIQNPAATCPTWASDGRQWRRIVPKMKTHKGIKKRFKVSARGKVMHKPINRGHLLSHKSGDRRRKLRREITVIPVLARKILRGLSA